MKNSLIIKKKKRTIKILETVKRNNQTSIKFHSNTPRFIYMKRANKQKTKNNKSF